jgi:hypothetical protein
MKVLVDPITFLPKGFAVCELENARSFKLALALNGVTFCKKKLKVILL